jgi:diacylglycerol kinase (ATP)
VNPVAGRGSAAAVAAKAVRQFPELEISDVFFTAARGDEAKLTEAALSRGDGTIIVIGGDGTCSRVAQTIIEHHSDCKLAVIPCGTGNDFAKSLGVADYAPEQIAALVARNDAARIDVGRADGHFFINSCGFGFDASVLEATQKVRFLKGDALYISSALAQLFSYRGLDVTIDGALRAKGKNLLMAVASNGRSLGGAFRIAPTASVTDGKLDFCLIADSNVLGRIRIFAGALRGTHLTLPGVTSIKGESLSLTFADKPAMEMDGELRRATSRTVKIECVPRALAVVAAPGAPV